MNTNNMNTKTHFGFRVVEKNKKAFMVENIFHSVAKKYDLMNDLMSFGIHRIWKDIAIKYSNVRRGSKVLDLAGGTGDIAAKFSQKVGEEGMVVLVDINDSMLKIGREKLRNNGILGNINYIQADAEALPFSDNTFDCIIISFGLRNITNKDKALCSMYRVLKFGGCLVILEFSTPILNYIHKIYNFYSFHILPKIGNIIACDAESYRYLAESIFMHPNQEALKLMILNSGFNNVEYFNITAGIVALHRGYKF